MSEISRCSCSVELGDVAIRKKVHKKSGPKPAFITLGSPELEIIGHSTVVEAAIKTKWRELAIGHP